MELADVLKAYRALPDDQRAAVRDQATAATKSMRWTPNPGPQTDGYLSQADILLFGGEPSGGKTQLILGCAFNQHTRSLIMRRQYTDLDAIIDEAKLINGGSEGYNGSAPPKLRFDDDRRIDFGAAARLGDEQSWMGRPHDLIGIDEATQFQFSQIRFLRGWLRTTKPGQRTRTILATNPPLSSDGVWVFEMFAPWLSPQFPAPAKPGELRWVVVDEFDKFHWVRGPGTHVVNGKDREAESLTFIPSKVTDNPEMNAKDYQKRLDALPAEHRKILLGGFRASFRDQNFQVIPTAWITAAQQRWTPEPPQGIPMCSMGLDCSGGGSDPFIIARRYDGWYAELIRVEGQDIPVERIGSHCAGIVFVHRRDGAVCVVDLGGGYGGPLYERLRDNLPSDEVVGYKGADGTEARTRDKKMGFTNTRGAALWKFREALDPDQEGGSPIALPNDPELVADLTAPTFKITARGYEIEAKKDVVKRLGRSTDKGDAVVMAWFKGPRHKTNALEWIDRKQRGRRKSVSVDLGPRRRQRA